MNSIAFIIDGGFDTFSRLLKEAVLENGANTDNIFILINDIESEKERFESALKPMEKIYSVIRNEKKKELADCINLCTTHFSKEYTPRIRFYFIEKSTYTTWEIKNDST